MKPIKLFNQLLVALCIVVMPLASQADNGDSKIAVVDIKRAVLQTVQAQKKLDQLKKQADFKGNMKEIEGLEKEYKKMLERYQKDRAVMSAEKREKEERSILEKQQDIKYVASKLQQTQKEFLDGLLQERAADTQQVLEGLVKEQNIGLLLRADAVAVMHADASYDISDQVTERLNAIK